MSTPCLDDHQWFQGRTGDSWRITRRMFADCSELLEYGAYRQTRYFMVTELFGESYHEVEQSLGKAIGQVGVIHSPRERIWAVLSRGKHSITIQRWIVSRCPLGGFQINVRRSSVQFQKPHRLFQLGGLVRNMLLCLTVVLKQKSFLWISDV